MTADELRAVLETELAWRQEELAFFKNQLNEVEESNKNKYRKSLVLILYSHMEGYIKIGLQTYIQYINSQGLNRRDVNTGLMVASMHKEFIAYENMERKSEFFRKALLCSGISLNIHQVIDDLLVQGILKVRINIAVCLGLLSLCSLDP